MSPATDPPVLRGLAEGLLTLLWPAACIGCETALGLEPRRLRPLSVLCPACLDEWLEREACHWKGGGAGLSGRALLVYGDRTRELLRAIKERGDRRLLARLAAAWARPPLAGAALAPVPSTALRRRQRGADPVLDLARCWSRNWGLPLIRPLRRRAGRAQKDLGAAERAGNLVQAFRLVGAVPANPPPLLLVDDVITTGATLEACASVLTGAGWPLAGGLSLFRTPLLGEGNPPSEDPQPPSIRGSAFDIRRA
jgi:predicted amidophosphoribosyltransferase